VLDVPEPYVGVAILSGTVSMTGPDEELVD
jgi:hypothetical protein